MDNEKCKYCRNSNKKEYIENGSQSEFRMLINDKTMEVDVTEGFENITYGHEIKINFCPFCGRKL